jgi:hypothetical protein
LYSRNTTRQWNGRQTASNAVAGPSRSRTNYVRSDWDATPQAPSGPSRLLIIHDRDSDDDATPPPVGLALDLYARE